MSARPTICCVRDFLFADDDVRLSTYMLVLYRLSIFGNPGVGYPTPHLNSVIASCFVTVSENLT